MPVDRLKLKTRKEKHRSRTNWTTQSQVILRSALHRNRWKGQCAAAVCFLLLLHIFLIFLEFQGRQAGVGHSCIFVICKQYFYGVCTKWFREYSLKIVVLRKQCKILTNIWTCLTLKWLFRRISRFSWNRIFSLIEDSVFAKEIPLLWEKSSLWEERETRIKLCLLSLLLKGTTNSSFSLIWPKFCFVFSQWRI